MRRIRRNKKKIPLILIILLLAVGTTLAYATLTSTLSITGNTLVEKATWDVHF